MAGGGEIKYDTGVMLGVAREVENQRAILKDCFERIREEALRLRGYHWDGTSAEAYHEIMDRLSMQETTSSTQNVGNVLSTLSVYVNDLTTTAAAYGAAEEKLIDRHESLPTDVFDV